MLASHGWGYEPDQMAGGERTGGGLTEECIEREEGEMRDGLSGRPLHAESAYYPRQLGALGF